MVSRQLARHDLDLLFAPAYTLPFGVQIPAVVTIHDLSFEVCPQESIFMDPINGLANICDLCRGEPQCVKWCPEEGVLQYQ